MTDLPKPPFKSNYPRLPERLVNQETRKELRVLGSLGGCGMGFLLLPFLHMEAFLFTTNFFWAIGLVVAIFAKRDSIVRQHGLAFSLMFLSFALVSPIIEVIFAPPLSELLLFLLPLWAVGFLRSAQLLLRPKSIEKSGGFIWNLAGRLCQNLNRVKKADGSKQDML